MLLPVIGNWCYFILEKCHRPRLPFQLWMGALGSNNSHRTLELEKADAGYAHASSQSYQYGLLHWL